MKCLLKLIKEIDKLEAHTDDELSAEISRLKILIMAMWDVVYLMQSKGSCTVHLKALTDFLKNRDD